MAGTESESLTEKETPKPKPRPIVRLGIFLISHSFLVSVVCCTAGVLALLLLPVLAKSTYISENALMPGSASPMISNQDVADGYKLVKDLINLKSKDMERNIESQRILAKYMSDLGAEVSYHKFHPQSNRFHPLHFFSNPDSGAPENFSCSSYGISTVGIIRAPRGDGKEAIVLATPYNSLTSDLNEVSSVGIAFSVFSLLSQVTWLAKDIIWLVADSRYGEYAPVATWLKDYHAPNFNSLSSLNDETCHDNLYELDGKSITDNFRRAGTMAAALILKVRGRSEEMEDTVTIQAEASNGQMPNLDLINVVYYLAAHYRQGFRVKVDRLRSLLNCNVIKVLGSIVEHVGEVAKSLNPKWKFGIPATDYVEGTATLASSLYSQALGVPTGPHGAFRDYQVDAITLQFSPKFTSEMKIRHNDFLLRGGRLIEGVIRSVNNLLEKFHQSFFLYLLTSPNKFVSIGVYMIAFALLIAPLPLVAASLYINSTNSNSSSTSPGISVRSWKWPNAAKVVFTIHLWGAVVSLLPYFICKIPDSTPTTCFMIWVLLAVISLLVLYTILASPFSRANSSKPQEGEWALLKSVTITALFIGLGLMSVINFATAEIGALLLVPMCLLARPLKLDLRTRSLRNFARAICNLVLGHVAFPPAAFLIAKGAIFGFGSPDVGEFWNWVESLWAWNSATYLYIGMVHLPCWVLCIHILLHSC